MILYLSFSLRLLIRKKGEKVIMEFHKQSDLLDSSNLLADLMEERVIDEENFQREFIVDLDFYSENNKSLNYILVHRFCKKRCYPRRMQFLKEGFIDMDSQGDKIEDSVEHIYRCCSRQSDFILDEMPLSERIFRVFLLNKLQPLNTHKISQQLNHYNLNNIFSILSNDTFYGFKEVKN